MLSKLAKARLESDPALLALAAPAVSDVWAPQVGPQAFAFESTADQIGYGGAAGGGKTDLAIGLSILKHQRSIIFRRTFPNARGIIERSRDLLGATARLNEQLHIWRLASGATIEIGSLPNEQDKFNHQGQARDLHVFDEATEFTETQVRFVIGWNRSALSGQHCQVLLTFNPPMDEGGEWVIPFFAPWLDEEYGDPAADGETRYVVRHNDQDTFYRSLADVPAETQAYLEDEAARQGMDGWRSMIKTRTFFHASLKDNPALAAQGYGATIEGLPEPLRSQLKGNFTAGKIADPWQAIPSEWVRAAQARWTDTQPDDALLSVGVDVARGGRDKTVLALLYGAWFAPLLKIPGIATPDGPSVAAVVQPYTDALLGVQIDVIGVGASAYDSLRANDVRVAPINGAAGAPITARDRSGKLKFRNVRALAYWKLREALDPDHGASLALPPDPELRRDLCTPKWSLTTAGILIEGKEDIIKRLGRSPDYGDAVVYAYYALINPSPEDLIAFVSIDDAA